MTLRHAMKETPLMPGLDPSLNSTGWAVVELAGRGRLVDAGAIRRAPAKNRLRVLQAAIDHLSLRVHGAVGSASREEVLNP